MSFRNDRFNRSVRSLEVLCEGLKDVSKAGIFSDGGAGARNIRECPGFRAEDAFLSGAAGCRTCEEARKARLVAAEMRLADAGKAHLIPVLLLIVENGRHIGESLRKVPRRTYFLHRKTLLEFFGCTQLHMDT